MKNIQESITALLESLGDDHDDRCSCDGCVNVNYPRPQEIKDAEHRWLCEQVASPEQLEWLKSFRPETWV